MKNSLKKCDKEDDLIELAVKTNFLAVKYETREEILSELCDATANYNIKDQIGWRILWPKKS